MRTVLGFLIQIFFLSASSAGLFIASHIIVPVKPVVSQKQTQLPRMSIRFDDFSLAYSALEDDYYVGEYEDEKIPSDVIATHLKPGVGEILPEAKPRFELPKLEIQPLSQKEPAASSWKPATQPELKNVVASIEKQQNLLGIKTNHFWIDGKIELANGLAITSPSDELRVGWFVEGRKMRDGRVKFSEGLYEAKVDRLEGELIAELVDKRGYVLGEAIIDLEILAKQRDIKSLEIHDVHLQLVPYNFGLSGQTVTVYHSDKSRSHLPETEVHVLGHDYRQISDIKGKLYDDAISNHSTALMSANHGQYRESLVLADMAREQVFRLFPEKFMEGFFDIIRLDKKLRDKGVIWGTIRREDVAAPGYRVRLAQDKAARSVYFTYYIADLQRQETSTDGQFSFVGLEDGDYEVEVVDGADQLIDSKLLAVRGGAVTVAEFEIGTRKTLYIKPFDPLTQTPKAVQFSAMGTEDVIAAQTEQVLKLPVTPGTDPILIYTKPADSDVESNTFASRTRKFQEIPVINGQWWSEIQNKYTISLESGVIIGFVDTGSPFQVYNEESDRSSKILYFNSQGTVVKEGERPSGFIIYNIGVGLKNIIIESDSGLLTTEAAYVDGRSLSLTYKSL